MKCLYVCLFHLFYFGLFCQIDTRLITIWQKDTVFEIKHFELLNKEKTFFENTYRFDIYDTTYNTLPEICYKFVNVTDIELETNINVITNKFNVFTKLEYIGCLCPIEDITLDFTTSTHLKEIALIGTKFKIIPKNILTNNSLTSIFIDIKNVKKICFENNNSIRQLTLFNSSLKQFSKSICNLNELKTITIYGNNISIPSCLKDIKIIFQK